MNFYQPQFNPTQQAPSYPAYRQPVPQVSPSWIPAPPTPLIRPVTSLEEVKACPIDFDGTVFYFTDIANKRIYTKFINPDGTVTLNVYELIDPKIADQTVGSSYVTRAEFNELAMKFQELLNLQESQSSAAQQQMYNF